MISKGHVNLHSHVLTEKRTFAFVDADNIKRGLERSLASAKVPAELRNVFSLLQLLLAAKLSRYFIYSAVPLDSDAPNWLVELRSQPQMILRSTLLKKTKNGSKQEGVDVMLAVEAMQNAAKKSMDACVIFSGDGDLLPLIDALVAEGIFVVVVSFDNPEKSGVASRLRDAADDYIHVGYSILKRAIAPKHALSSSGGGQSKVQLGPGEKELTLESHERKYLAIFRNDGSVTVCKKDIGAGWTFKSFRSEKGAKAHLSLSFGDDWA